MEINLDSCSLYIFSFILSCIGQTNLIGSYSALSLHRADLNINTFLQTIKMHKIQNNLFNLIYSHSDCRMSAFTSCKNIDVRLYFTLCQKHLRADGMNQHSPDAHKITTTALDSQTALMATFRHVHSLHLNDMCFKIRFICQIAFFSLTYFFCRDSTYNRIRLNILRYNSTSCYDSSLTHSNTRKYYCS